MNRVSNIPLTIKRVRLLNYSCAVWICLGHTYPKIYRNMLGVKPRATLDLIFFTI